MQQTVIKLKSFMHLINEKHHGRRNCQKHYFLRMGLLACLITAPPPNLCFAQASRAMIGPAPGYIRFWDMVPAMNGAFELRALGSSPTGAPLRGGTAFEYASYSETPAGRYRLIIVKKGDSTSTPLRTFDLDLKPNSFFTFIVRPTAGRIDAEMIEDTADPKTSFGTLVIRNYFPGLTVTVSTGSRKLAEALPYGQTFVAANLPQTRVPLTITTQLPNGTPAESGSEADLKVSNRGTLLIIPDSYGRFRPRVTIDGKN